MAQPIMLTTSMLLLWCITIQAAWIGSLKSVPTNFKTQAGCRQEDSFLATPHAQGTAAIAPNWSRRELLIGVLAASSVAVIATPHSALAYTPDPDKLQESLYLISRVQEATVQQERFVRRTKLQEDLRNKMKLTLKLVEKNYLLLDQINFASSFVKPDDIVTATEAGNLAVDALQSAIDYVKSDLGTGPLRDEQRDFLTDAMKETRDNLFIFLKYMPADKLAAARQRVEEENVKNREEFEGDSDAGVYNPVVLPWKEK